MHYFDPARPRLPNGLPAWRDAPNIALPRLIFTPAPPPNKVIIQAMINASWKTFILDEEGTSLDTIIFYWRANPEQFAHDYFGVESLHVEGAPQPDENLPSIDPADLGI